LDFAMATPLAAGNGRRFAVDARAAELAAVFGSAEADSPRAAAAPLPESWGLNINVASPPPEELRVPYEALCTRLAGAMRGSGAYLYPFRFLHVTVASPAPFTACDVPHPAERAALERGWAQALRDACVPDEGYPSAPFPLVFARVSLSRAAAIFEVEDPTGAIEHCRRIVRGCEEAPPLADLDEGGLAGGLLARSGFKVPGIIHATFLRFAAPADAGVDDDAIQRSFNAVAATWVPVTVVCDRLLLVRETVPYMHLDLHGKDAAAIIAELPFGP
jgi:hypothetical protein